MVYAFIAQSLGPAVGDGTEHVEVLYSEVFGAGMNINAPADDQRKLRQTQIHQISQRINSEFVFRKASSSSVTVTGGTPSAERLFPSVEAGVFRLPKNRPLPLEKHVIWQAMGNFGFSLVLSPDENKAIAENVLSLIVRCFLRIFSAVDGFEEIKTCPEKIATVLHIFLPNGQLLFMNHRVVRQMEISANQILNEKK